MKIFILFFILVLFIRCGNNENSGSKSQTETKKENIDTTNKSKTEVLLIDSTKIPSLTFLKLVDFIHASGYTHDTAFIHKVGMYRYSDSILNVDGKLFYNLKPEQTLILDFCKITKEYPGFEEPNMFNEKLYNVANHVFAYYYRENFKDEFINDGFIEEWYFEDSIQAEKAQLDFKEKHRYLIANTSSFGHRKKNRLYIMYTRAAGFGIFLDKVYQQLKALK